MRKSSKRKSFRGGIAVNQIELDEDDEIARQLSIHDVDYKAVPLDVMFGPTVQTQEVAHEVHLIEQESDNKVRELMTREDLDFRQFNQQRNKIEK